MIDMTLTSVFFRYECMCVLNPHLVPCGQQQRTIRALLVQDHHLARHRSRIYLDVHMRHRILAPANHHLEHRRKLMSALD